MSEPLPGVVTVPTLDVSGAIRSQVAAYLATLPPDTNGAILSVQTGAGFNLAVAHKAENGRWAIGAFIGKSGWDQPVQGGVTGQVMW